MMNSSLRIPVTPEVLRWAREEMEVKEEDAAREAGIELDELRAWERDGASIPLSTLQVLRKLYKKPLAVFLLSTPPKRVKQPTDHRTFRNGTATKTKNLLLAIRRAQRMQEVFRDTLNENGETAVAHLPRFPRPLTPRKLAALARQDFQLSLETQIKWKDEREGLTALMRLVEAKGVLVFQMTFDPKDARGFILPNKHPPVIVMSSSDAVRARIFTLLHEYCHLLLGQEGISDWNDRNPTERYCNQFASAFLMPLNALRAHLALAKYRSGVETNISVVVHMLVKDFKVSAEAVLTALVSLDVISQDFYDEERRRIAAEVEEYKKRKKKGGPSPAVKCVAQRGVPYVSAVISANKEGKIGLSDVSDYLDIRQKHLPKIESLVRQKNYEYAGETV